MGSIGAGSPEAAAAAMAGSGQTSAAAAGGGGGGGGGGGVPPELSKWITQKENFSKTAFSDYGQTNIGYGTSARGRTSISEPEAFAEMNEKLSGSLDRIDKLNPKLTKGQRIALASLDFNTGWTTRGGEKNDAMRKAIREGDVAGARQLFLTYSHVGGPHGQVLPGLLKRREQEVPGFDDPNYFGGKRGTSAAEDFGGKMDPAAARRMQDRQIVDRRSIKTVKVDATGKVAVKIGGGSDATLDSQGLFKPTTLERRTQMTPATTGPKADAPASFREKLEAIP
jgi:GH24 family phage-related lysozyme (muramidase)